MAELRGRVLQGIPLVLLGLFTYSLIFPPMGPFLDPIIEQCTKDEAARRALGVPGLDQCISFMRTFLCFIVPVFREGIAGPDGAVIWAYLVSVFQPCMAFVAIEGSRKAAVPPLTFVAVFFALYQLLGVSITMPLLYLPAYLILGQYDIYSRKGREAAYLAPVRVMAIAIMVNLSTVVAILPLMTRDEPSFDLLVQLFQFFPVLVPLVCLPFSNQISVKGNRVAAATYLTLGGASLLTHLGCIAYLVLHPEVFQSLIALFSSHDGAVACKFFLLIDAIVLSLSLLYTVAIESGRAQVGLALVGSVFGGPGAALAVHFALKEVTIARRAIGMMEGIKDKDA